MDETQNLKDPVGRWQKVRGPRAATVATLLDRTPDKADTGKTASPPTARRLFWTLLLLYVLGSLAAVVVVMTLSLLGLEFTTPQWRRVYRPVNYQSSFQPRLTL